MSKRDSTPSGVLPADAFDQALSRLMGLPNGANTSPSVVQDVDFYGNVTSWMVQTVKHEGGETVFLTAVNAAGSARYVLPPKVLVVIDRQRASTLTQVKRRHGRRIAAERKARGEKPGFMRDDAAPAAGTTTEAATAPTEGAPEPATTAPAAPPKPATRSRGAARAAKPARGGNRRRVVTEPAAAPVDAEPVLAADR